MARGTLHAPKSAETRHRRNAPAHGEQLVYPDGIVRGPDLGDGYSDQTVEWYATWRTSPQAQLFQATDWSRLRLLASIVDAYYRRPSAAALSEIRMNEERLGATVVDRMRARIRVEDDAPEATVTPLRAVARRDVAARLAGD